MPPFKDSPPPDRRLNDNSLQIYCEELKSIMGLGQITSYDLLTFYALMEDPTRFSKEELRKLFGFLSQVYGAEGFSDKKEADDCLRMIENVKTEIGM